MKSKKDDSVNVKALFFVIGIILMLISAIMMFSNIFIVNFDSVMNKDFFLEYDDIEIFKSPALGLLTLGAISILISKEIKEKD